MDELQAAILNVKLKHLNEDNSRRREIAKIYSEKLNSLPINLPTERPSTNHVYHLYVVACSNRDKLKKYLTEKNIITGIHYPKPAHLHNGYYQKAILTKQGFPVTNNLAENILSLPIYPQITNEELNEIINTLYQYFNL